MQGAARGLDEGLIGTTVTQKSFISGSSTFSHHNVQLLMRSRIWTQCHTDTEQDSARFQNRKYYCYGADWIGGRGIDCFHRL